MSALGSPRQTRTNGRTPQLGVPDVAAVGTYLIHRASACGLSAGFTHIHGFGRLVSVGTKPEWGRLCTKYSVRRPWIMRSIGKLRSGRANLIYTGRKSGLPVESK
jgi:hypothetical protein